MSAEKIKQIWPEWTVEKDIGKGAFGMVYKAVRSDNNINSYAAIKVISIPQEQSEVDTLRSDGIDIDGTRTYFKRVVDDFVTEIQLMESLKGIQNIVSVEDYKVIEKTDEIGWDIYIRMELLTPFIDYAKDNKLSEADVIKLGVDICTALEICGKRNIIHRDIKPENIFVNDFGYFKLGDFGIARKLENVTGGLSQKGTINYMAPEVANSSHYDSTVDTYSLGIVLYKLLNENRLPFVDPDKLLNPIDRKVAAERRIHGEPLTPPCEASPAMADLILHACAFSFASAAEMKQALMSVANGTYQIVENDLDKTVSVFNAPDGIDKTTSVRKAPAAVNPKAVTVQNTFGTPKKKGKVPVAIAAVLAAVILVGAGALALPKLLSSNNRVESDEKVTGEASPGEDSFVSMSPVVEDDTAKEPQPDDSPSEAENEAKLEQERIASIISEAETLANGEDFEAALAKIQAGLADHPESAELKTKADAYTESLNAQIKAGILAQAKSLADSGDYAGAMDVIKNAQQTNGDDADYQSAYNTYSDAHIASVKEETAKTADSLAADGDYIGAIAAIEQAVKTIGEDADLSAKIEQYRQAHVSATIQTANSYAADKNYTQALSVLDEAIKLYPDNVELQNAKTLVENMSKTQEAVAVSNPNQNPVAPKEQEEHDIKGGSGKANAVSVQREDLYHSSFTAEGTVDWYKFTTSGNYSAYSIEFLNNSINTYLYLTVFDAYDKEIGSADIDKGRTGYIDISLESNKEYWIKVHRHYNDRMGNYQFAIKEKICDAGMRQTEAFSIDLGVTNTKSFDVHSLFDWYKFTTTGNYSTYQFKLLNNSINTYLYLKVYDEYNTELGSISADKGNSELLDLRLDANREYTVRMSRHYDDRNGYYQMSVSEMICDSGLNQDEAVPLKLNETFYGTADTAFSEWYMYTFAKKGNYTLSITNNSINTYTYATLYDKLGTELASTDANKGYSDSASINIENDNTVLYVKISRHYADRFGNYTLSVTGGN